MKYISINNWEKFQCYKDRDPKWIKLYRSLLDNYEYSLLDDSAKAHLVGIWLLAAKIGNEIPADPEWIATKIAARSPIDLDILKELGFIDLYESVQNDTESYNLIQKGGASPSVSLSVSSSVSSSGEGESEGKGEPDPTRTVSRSELPAYGEFNHVHLSDEEYAKLTIIHGCDKLAKGISRLDDYMESKGKRYKNHYAVLKETGWVWRELNENSRRTADGRRYDK